MSSSPKPLIGGYSIPSTVEKNKPFTISAIVVNIGETGDCYLIIEDLNKNKYIANWRGILGTGRYKQLSTTYSIDKTTKFEIFSGYIDSEGRGHIVHRVYKTVYVSSPPSPPPSPKAEISRSWRTGNNNL